MQVRQEYPTRSLNRIYYPEDRLPLVKLIPMGVQHVIAMFGGTVLAPILMGFDPISEDRLCIGLCPDPAKSTCCATIRALSLAVQVGDRRVSGVIIKKRLRCGSAGVLQSTPAAKAAGRNQLFFL